MTYLDQLKAERATAAANCERIANRIVMGGRTDAGDALHTWAVIRDSLDQQIAWMNRRTGWAWPTEPAWTN